jgi:hypothetical protein
VQLYEVDAADAATAPILALPREDQISWINKRAHRGSMLSVPRFQGSSAADELREGISVLR